LLIIKLNRFLHKLKDLGAEWVQFDEPFLALDLTEKEQKVFKDTYKQLRQEFPHLKMVLATYFDRLGSNTALVTSLPIDVIHIDLVRAPQQLDEVMAHLPEKIILSLGVVDGRNIWKNDFEQSLAIIQKAIEKLGSERIWIAPSCSLIHSPCDLKNEKQEEVLTPEIKQWLAFAKQKVSEVVTLKNVSSEDQDALCQHRLAENKQANASRKSSTLIHNQVVKQRVSSITEKDAKRLNIFPIRKKKQQQLLNLPLLATTTIGSFPQTAEVRSWRAQFKKGSITEAEYISLIEQETAKAIQWQEEIDLDVLVHGEFERNDMVEYFGEQLSGFTFTQNGWVQSYGSRCVKPPIIYGDVSRPEPMTVRWSVYAQSLTSRWMKGMLTGPVTILQWSFVRNDQPRSETCTQIALAIRDEVCDLETAGIKIIQIDEPAIREGLPLCKEDWAYYLDWAVKAFRISASGVQDDTQIHTHMCYSEFNDIIQHICILNTLGF
jgi:5-methyltetrahydropteroyltriglutamate--homocysteine methyltransferase